MNNFKGGAGRTGGFRKSSGASRPPFKKKSWGSSSAPRGARPAFRKDAGDSRATMFDAICSTCGKACQVPFEPSGNRPVACRDCFVPKSEMGDRSPRFNKFESKRPYERSSAPRFNKFESNRSYDRSAAPSFETRPAATSDAAVQKQLAEINKKIDALIEAVAKIAG